MAQSESKKTNGAPAVEPVAPQPPQPHQYQQQYVQPVAYKAPKKASSHPTLEASIGVVSVLLAVLLITSLFDSVIALLGGQAFTVGVGLPWLADFSAGYSGLVGAALAAVGFALFAWWLFGRVARVEDASRIKTTPYLVGVGVLAVKSVVAAAAVVGSALTPLLTIREGVNTGAAYLYEFLPAVLALAVIVFAGYFLAKQVKNVRVGSLLSGVLLGVASLLTVLSVIAVIVRSHDESYVYYGNSSQSQTQNTNTKELLDSMKISPDTKTKDSTDTTKKKNTSSDVYKGDAKTSSECFDEYMDKTSTINEYSACVEKVLGS